MKVIENFSLPFIFLLKSLKLVDLYKKGVMLNDRRALPPKKAA